MSRSPLRPLILFALFLSLLAGCTSKQNGPAQAVEGYFKAMVAQDKTQITGFACASWEAQAQVDADAFAGVTAVLQDLACQVSGTDGNTTLVTCTGKIVASYNGENREFPLDGRTYQAIQESGEWRMCGYQ